MPKPYKKHPDSVSIRLTGNIDKINQLTGRLGLIAELENQSQPLPNWREPFGYRVYVKAYIYPGLETHSLYDQLLALRLEVAELSNKLAQFQSDGPR